MVQTVAVSGASGRTGFRVVEELLETGMSPRMLMRQSSVLEDQRPDLEQIRLDLFDSVALDAALQGVDALVLTIGGKANAPTPHLSLIVLMGGATKGSVAAALTVPSASLMSYRDIDHLAFGNKGSWHFIVPGWIGLST